MRRKRASQYELSRCFLMALNAARFIRMHLQSSLGPFCREFSKNASDFISNQISCIKLRLTVLSCTDMHLNELGCIFSSKKCIKCILTGLLVQRTIER